MKYKLDYDVDDIKGIIWADHTNSIVRDPAGLHVISEGGVRWGKGELPAGGEIRFKGEDIKLADIFDNIVEPEDDDQDEPEPTLKEQVRSVTDPNVIINTFLDQVIKMKKGGII